MKFLGLGVPELVIILVVVLLIFGPKNLPKLGSALGKTVKGLRDGMGAAKKEAEPKDEEDDEVVEAEPVEENKASETEEEPAKKVRRVVKKAE